MMVAFCHISRSGSRGRRQDDQRVLGQAHRLTLARDGRGSLTILSPAHRTDRIYPSMHGPSRLPGHLRLAADHQAEPALEPEHATARAHVDEVHALGLENLRPGDVVAVVAVAAVDDNVTRRQQRSQFVDGAFGGPAGRQ